jgi:hypothetical protein
MVAFVVGEIQQSERLFSPNSARKVGRVEQMRKGIIQGFGQYREASVASTKRLEPLGGVYEIRVTCVTL